MKYFPLLLVVACSHPKPDLASQVETCWLLYGPRQEHGFLPVNAVTETDRPIMRCLVETYGWTGHTAQDTVLARSFRYRVDTLTKVRP